MRRLATLATLAVTVLWAVPAAALVGPWDIVPVEDTDGAIAGASSMPDVYLANTACKFFKTRPDIYDVIFVFDSSKLDFFSNTQQGWVVKQPEKGIGRMAWNQAAKFCAKQGRLKQAVKMGSIDILPDNPDDMYKGIAFYTLTGIELMGHEFGHHWMAAITFKKEDGVRHCLARAAVDKPDQMDNYPCDGYDEGEYNQHWSYYFNSGGIMYGNNITQLEDGRFRIYNDGVKFGPLDQYLMGIRPPEEVGPLFVAYQGDGAMPGGDFPAPPRKEQIITGKRYDFTVDDVIRDLGPRDPPYGKEACHWKGAMLVVHPKGTKVSQAHIDKLVTYANRWEDFYAWSTDYRGSMDLTISGSGAGTDGCPAPTAVVPDSPGTDVPDVPDVAEVVEEVAGDPGAGTDPGSTPADPGPIADPGAGIDTAGSDLAGIDLAASADRGGTGDGAGAACVANAYACDGNRRMKCDAQGASLAFVENCGAKSLVCEAGACVEDTGAKGGGCTAGATGAAGMPWGAVTLAFLLAFAGLRRRRPRNLRSAVAQRSEATAFRSQG